jgi:catechol 2,3-dioxygenase-like lactoylglutathione lyase family enzyme
MGLLSKFIGGGTMIKGIDHVAIVVSHMERSIRFYSEVLGLEIHHDGRNEGGRKKSFLGTKSRTLVALTEDANLDKRLSESVQSVGHIAFRVDDVEAAKEALKGKGVEFVEEKFEKDTNRKAYHFLDPDGLELEIYGEIGQKAVY